MISPIIGHDECISSACETRNQWTDTQLIGNTIETSGTGIEATLHDSAGDVVRGLVVEGNMIRLGSLGTGVHLRSGEGGGADGNRIAEVVVAHNTIEGEAPGSGVSLVSGFRGGSANVVRDVTIADNSIRFTGSPPPGFWAEGVSMVLSDDCFPSGCTGPNPVEPEDNVVREIKVIDNTVEGVLLIAVTRRWNRLH